MVVMLLIQVFFIVFDRYIFLMQPREWRDYESFRFKDASKKEQEQQ